MKLFEANNMSIIENCLIYFNFKLLSALLITRKTGFLNFLTCKPANLEKSGIKKVRENEKVRESMLVQ
jgi:hypothetical protein